MLAARHSDDKTTHPLPARMSADSSTVSKTDESELDVVGTADSPRPSLHAPTPLASSVNHSGKFQRHSTFFLRLWESRNLRHHRSKKNRSLRF